MITDDTARGRDLDREARHVFALFNMIALDTGHYEFDRPVPLFSANDPAFIVASRARIAALIVPSTAIDEGLAAQRAWVERSGYDLIMIRDSAPMDPASVEVDALRAGVEGAVDEGRFLLWSGEDDVRVDRSGLWLVTPDEASAELSRALLVTGRGLLASERPPYRDKTNRGAGLRLAAQAFRKLLINAAGYGGFE